MNRRHYFVAPILLQAVIYAVTFIVFKGFARLEIRGAENVKGIKGRVIFAPNHASEWDGPLVRTCLPYFWAGSPMYYVGMTREFYRPLGLIKSFLYGGAFFNMLGAYPAYRGTKDYAVSLSHFIELLSQDHAVCIFPEGGRTKDGTLGEARGGVAFLAKETGAPTVPVAIQGLTRLKSRQLFSFNRRVTVTFGKPIPADELVPGSMPAIEDYKEGSKKIMAQVSAMLQNSK